MTADRLVLGTAQLAQPYGVANRSGPPPRPEAVDLVRSAADAGVGGLDTAPAYGDAESVIGEADVETPVFTKLDAAASKDPERIDTSIRGSLERLRRATIDVLFLHDPRLVVDDPLGVIGRAAAWLGRGVAKLGASVYDAEEFRAALHDDRVGAIQAPLSLADRRLERELHEAAERGKPVYARSAFLQGALLMDAAELPSGLRSLQPLLVELDAACRRSGTTRHHALVAYARDLPGVQAVVLGCEHEVQLRQNVEAITSPGLRPDELDRLAGLLPKEPAVLDPRRWKP